MKRVIFIILSLVFVTYSVISGAAAVPEVQPAEDSAPTGSHRVAFISQYIGRSRSIAVQGSYAYLGVGRQVTIFDISDVAHPIPVGTTEDLPYVVCDLTVNGIYAYILSGNLLLVTDISQPFTPTLTASLTLPVEAFHIEIQDNLAYVADGVAGLHIIDISDPPSPNEVGFYDSPVEAVGVAVAGGYAYIADGYGGGMRIVDVSTPSSPVGVGYYEIQQPMYTNSLAVKDNYVYLTTNYGYHGGSLNKIDVSNPSAPVWIANVGSIYNYQSVALVGDYAYAAIGAAIEIVDVSGNFQYIGYISFPAYDIAAPSPANYVFVEGNGLRIFDISNPSTPVLAGVYDTLYEASNFVIRGDIAYITAFDGNMYTFDISQPKSPRELGFVDMDLYSDMLYDITVSGNYAYLAYGNKGLIIVDISDPNNLLEAGSADQVFALGVAVISDTAYVVGDKLYILDVSNPASPVEIGSLPMPDSDHAWGVTVVGNYAYVAAGFNGVRIYNISDPSAPVEVGGAFLNYASNVIVRGNLAYIVGSGFLILDVSIPNSPEEVGYYPLLGYASGLSIDGNLAYIADGVGGLRIIDISQPVLLHEVGYYDSFQISDVDVSNGYAYTAAGWDGLVVLRYAPFTVNLPLVMSMP